MGGRRSPLNDITAETQMFATGGIEVQKDGVGEVYQVLSFTRAQPIVDRNTTAPRILQTDQNNAGWEIDITVFGHAPAKKRQDRFARRAAPEGVEVWVKITSTASTDQQFHHLSC